MTQPQDAALQAALQARYRELTTLLARVQRAQRELVPPPATFWHGGARRHYDAALEGLAGALDAGALAVRAARDHTHAAMAQVASRG